MIKTGSKVYYKQPRCACNGGGFTENFGTVVDRINTPNGKLFYKVSTDYQGTFVVPADNIIREIENETDKR